MRLVRWLIWAILLLAATAAIYWLLASGGEPQSAAAAADAGRAAAATDQLTEKDRRDLDDLIRQRLQARDGGGP